MAEEKAMVKAPKVSLAKIPTLESLISESEDSLKENALMVLLNQPPPEKWLKPHPIAKTKNDEGKDVPAVFLPINKVEYVLTRVYTKWWVEVKSVQVIANSVVVTVRLHVVNPLNGEYEWQDGVGAVAIQTNSGAGAMDWNQAKSSGVQMAAPAAETYAVKDAAEKFGKIFGRDLNRRDVLSYDNLLKNNMTNAEKEHERILLMIEDCKTVEEIVNFRESLSTELQEKYAQEINTKADSFLNS